MENVINIRQRPSTTPLGRSSKQIRETYLSKLGISINKPTKKAPPSKDTLNIPTSDNPKIKSTEKPDREISKNLYRSKNPKVTLYLKLGILPPYLSEKKHPSYLTKKYSPPTIQTIQLPPYVLDQLKHLNLADDTHIDKQTPFIRFQLNELQTLQTISDRLKDTIATMGDLFVQKGVFASKEEIIVKIFLNQIADDIEKIENRVIFTKYKFHLDFFEMQHFKIKNSREALPVFPNAMVYCGENFNPTEIAAINTTHLLKQFRCFNDFLQEIEINPFNENEITTFPFPVQIIPSNLLHRAPEGRDPSDLVISFRSEKEFECFQ